MNEASIYRDLLVTERDLTLNQENEPVLVHNRACISQDIKHLIIETGLMFEMIGERDDLQVRYLARKIEKEIETDSRIVPGTAKLHRKGSETFFVVADTREFGPIEILINE